MGGATSSNIINYIWESYYNHQPLLSRSNLGSLESNKRLTLFLGPGPKCRFFLRHQWGYLGLLLSLNSYKIYRKTLLSTSGFCADNNGESIFSCLYLYLVISFPAWEANFLFPTDIKHMQSLYVYSLCTVSEGALRLLVRFLRRHAGKCKVCHWNFSKKNSLKINKWHWFHITFTYS